MYYKNVEIEIGGFEKSGKRWKYVAEKIETQYCKVVNETMEIITFSFDYKLQKKIYFLKNIDLSAKHTSFTTIKKVTQATYSKYLKKFNLKSELKAIKPKKERIYTIDCTGNVCVGDQVKFEKAIFEGQYPNATFSHNEVIKGKVIKDSYGKNKQQHTFTIQLSKNDTLRIKGRNLYKNGTLRKPWKDEAERLLILEDKYTRGNKARKDRKERIELKNLYQEY